MYDVIVIGGGPVGSYLAYKLARAGHGVLVLDQKQKLREQVCCTGVISQECVDSFAVDDSVILRRANSARIFSPSGRLVRLWRPETQACVLDRAAFDAIMAEQAQAEGAEYVLNRIVKNIEVMSDRVKVRVKVGVTRRVERNLEARAVVIATGAGSRLIEALGLASSGDFVLGAQAEVKTTEVEEVEVYLGRKIAPGFFAWLVPTSPQSALVGLLSRRTPQFYLRRLMSSLLTQGKIVSTEAELSYRGVRLEPPSRTYSKRLIVVGGAAGQVKPTTGGGIYYGLQCADIAANNLHQALESDDLSAKNLAKYEREWKEKLGRELKIGYWARRLYEHLSDKQIDMIFNIIESNDIATTLLKADDLSFDWHGGAMLRLLRHKSLTRALGLRKVPFLSRG